MKKLFALIFLAFVSACATTQEPQVVTVTRVYFPEPPEVLMKPPVPLETIDQKKEDETPVS